MHLDPRERRDRVELIGTADPAAVTSRAASHHVQRKQSRDETRRGSLLLNQSCLHEFTPTDGPSLVIACHSITTLPPTLPFPRSLPDTQTNDAIVIRWTTHHAPIN